MPSYAKYVERVERLALNGDRRGADFWIASKTALDGEPSRMLREAKTPDNRRKLGSFFTSKALAELALAKRKFNSNSRISDPACGAGDLLLAAARRLPVRKTLHLTLKYWSETLGGADIRPEFVRLAKARLAILARQRVKDRKPLQRDLSRYFTSIRVKDALNHKRGRHRINLILLNPPFGLVDAPRDCTWGSGRVNSGALFLQSVLEAAGEGARLIAILPDVLRTGSRYKLWRANVSRLLRVTRLDHYGVFDASADVDVFILEGCCRRSNRPRRIEWWPPNKKNTTTVAEHFTVSVGAVVPHRHKRKGPLRPYLHAKSLPRWKSLRRIGENRKFMGPVTKPPFVVIRRTSRRGDPNRAVATIIASKSDVAVENHLIICRPKNGTLKQCKALLTQLRSHKTTRFLDERIRCRHLTVEAIKELPFVGERVAAGEHRLTCTVARNSLGGKVGLKKLTHASIRRVT